MPSPIALIVPFGLLLVGGGIAAAASKKKQQTETGAAETPAAATGTTTPTTPPGAAATVAASGTIPADVQALIVAAITSQNPTTMRRAADQLQAKYPLQAADLRKAASDFETAIAAAQASGAASTAAATTAAAAQTAAQQVATAAAQVGMTVPQLTAYAPSVGMTVQQLAASILASGITNLTSSSLGPPQAPTVPSGAGPVAVPAGTPAATPATSPPLSPMPTPTATTAPPTASADRLRAAALVVKLKTAKKGTASEPRSAVQEFQLVERLSRTDGSYGSETALALADKYGIVPPKPLYWGKKGGSYATLVADKNQYKAHLLNLASRDPQRADEWRSAAQV